VPVIKVSEEAGGYQWLGNTFAPHLPRTIFMEHLVACLINADQVFFHFCFAEDLGDKTLLQEVEPDMAAGVICHTCCETP